MGCFSQSKDYLKDQLGDKSKVKWTKFIVCIYHLKYTLFSQSQAWQDSWPSPGFSKAPIKGKHQASGIQAPHPTKSGQTGNVQLLGESSFLMSLDLIFSC